MPTDNRGKRELQPEFEEQGSLITMLVTFAGLVVAATIICSIVWVVSHRNPRQQMETNQLMGNQDVDETLVETQLPGEDSSTSQSIEVEPVAGDLTMTFDPVDEMVTAKQAAILRSVPNPDGVSTVVGQLKNGDTMQRVGVNPKTGWSRLIYEGAEVYAVTYMLTTDLNYRSQIIEDANHVMTSDGKLVIFKDCDDNVTARELVNMRTEPSTAQGSATVSGQLNTEFFVHRIAYSPDAGWSKVEHNGKILYVVTSYVHKVDED